MTKKKCEPLKCEECGYRLFLTSFGWYDIEVEPDQEPYEADKVEPVMVDGKEAETVFVEFHAIAHVCPNCKFIRQIEVNKDY